MNNPACPERIIALDMYGMILKVDFIPRKYMSKKEQNKRRKLMKLTKGFLLVILAVMLISVLLVACATNPTATQPGSDPGGSSPGSGDTNIDDE